MVLAVSWSTPLPIVISRWYRPWCCSLPSPLCLSTCSLTCCMPGSIRESVIAKGERNGCCNSSTIPCCSRTRIDQPPHLGGHLQVCAHQTTRRGGGRGHYSYVCRPLLCRRHCPI